MPDVHGGAGQRRAPLPTSRMASSIVSGTPSAVPDEPPKLDRMSLRTMPLSVSTFGPFEPSPGKGPFVSSGMTSHSAAAVVAPAVEVPPAKVDPEVPIGLGVSTAARAGGHSNGGGGEAHQAQHAAPIDEHGFQVKSQALIEDGFVRLGQPAAAQYFHTADDGASTLRNRYADRLYGTP